MIIPVYKPLGASSHKLAWAIGQSHSEKATHTGTLDPMAEGVLVVLTGDDRFKKSELSHTKKEYTFSILFGISTDSHDLLGLPTLVSEDKNNPSILYTKVSKLFSKMIGTAKQEQPVFSAGRENGLSFFELGKKQQKPTQQKNNAITIHALECTNIFEIKTSKVLEYHSQKISQVSGDFRQATVLKTWNELSNSLPPQLCLATCTAVVSRRTYIRGIVRDISKKLGIPATTYSLLRTKNGHFSVADCQTI